MGLSILLLGEITVEQAYGKPYGECAHHEYGEEYEDNILELDPHGVGIDHELPITTQANDTELLLQQAEYDAKHEPYEGTDECNEVAFIDEYS